ncbi:DUF6944 family repetitive protein [Pseudalkalibacillus berkeleyi]|uniref:Uncharacterized protein n=1 Tax=Pseudalkalibacillus berkeleyi TaxID=1069813 RepID=A0ABS9H233_9BACL|nr:hypothetical protein [Pseudalkalibacillus berkeleyi]MCF6139037.1 hypothetical protein [Pseudalkalibacillus berkeleyi]
MGKQQVIEITGSWTQAVGTILAAIGSTPSFNLPKQVDKNLRIVGNALQALGNAIQAAGSPTITLETTGNKIQVVGNLTVIYGIVADIPNVKKQEFEIAGNWLQALGALLAVFEQLSDIRKEFINILGNVLQSWGNSLQAIGGIIGLEGNDQLSTALDVNGSWIQALGSVFTAGGTTFQSEDEGED